VGILPSKRLLDRNNVSSFVSKPSAVGSVDDMKRPKTATSTEKRGGDEIDMRVRISET
jgi:hypothetical protein